MPGAYAHITLVNEAKRPQYLEQKGVPAGAIAALLDYFKFCELGAVSPDYQTDGILARHTEGTASQDRDDGAAVTVCGRFVATSLVSPVNRGRLSQGFEAAIASTAHVYLLARTPVPSVIQSEIGFTRAPSPRGSFSEAGGETTHLASRHERPSPQPSLEHGSPTVGHPSPVRVSR